MYVRQRENEKHLIKTSRKRKESFVSLEKKNFPRSSFMLKIFGKKTYHMLPTGAGMGVKEKQCTFAY